MPSARKRTDFSGLSSDLGFEQQDDHHSQHGRGEVLLRSVYDFAGLQSIEGADLRPDQSK